MHTGKQHISHDFLYLQYAWQESGGNTTAWENEKEEE